MGFFSLKNKASACYKVQPRYPLILREALGSKAGIRYYRV
jgi:hypothetical protein